jgi:arsenate reductase-like glutaredoxin family protein
MEAQVFGTKNSNDTKKALRFFKERRIKVHFVDLDQRPVAAGELRHFGQKHGWAALLSIEPAHGTTLSESHVVPMLERHPDWLVTPLVRVGNEVAVGWNEDRWRAFLKTAQ